MSHSMALSANPLSSGLSLQNLGASTGTTKLRAADTSSPTTGSSTGTSANSSDTDSIGTTFLSLLVQELQNQDPTAPMDSTAMVGQMISLNQLDQLTNIDQTLSNAYGGSSTTSSSTSGTTSGSTSGTTSGTSSGASPNALSSALGSTLGGAASQDATTSAATAAAMRLLASNGFSSQPGVSTSVSLPAF